MTIRLQATYTIEKKYSAFCPTSKPSTAKIARETQWRSKTLRNIFPTKSQGLASTSQTSLTMMRGPIEKGRGTSRQQLSTCKRVEIRGKRTIVLGEVFTLATEMCVAIIQTTLWTSAPLFKMNLILRRRIWCEIFAKNSIKRNDRLINSNGFVYFQSSNSHLIIMMIMSRNQKALVLSLALATTLLFFLTIFRLCLKKSNSEPSSYSWSFS